MDSRHRQVMIDTNYDNILMWEMIMILYIQTLEMFKI